MDFARRQMQKQGWTEGSGLGKNEDGRSKAIKVTLKMDKRGMGHDPGKEFTDHWWLRVFNEAAQKVGNKDKEAEVVAEELDEKKQKEEKKKSLYGGFVQASLLTNGVEEAIEKTDSSSEEDEVSSVSVPTLEDIHKFCGGATGHKAARHGITMEGKLDRVTKLEKIYEEKLKKRFYGDKADAEETTQSKKKKKKKRKQKESEEDLTSKEPDTQLQEKSKRRKKKRETEDLEPEKPNPDQAEEAVSEEASSINIDSVDGGDTVHSRKKRKKDKNDLNQVFNNPSEDSSVDDLDKKLKKKKKKRKHNDEEPAIELPQVGLNEKEECSYESKKKKKKKKKR